MQNAPVIATELNCQFCGWPLIKNGELVCDRSGHAVKATLGEKRIFCPFCRKPKVTLAKNDRAICPKCEQGKKEGTPMAGGFVDIGAEVHSKTKELQEWLDDEIIRLKSDAGLLWNSISEYERRRKDGTSMESLRRYQELTSEEIEVKVAEDRKKLEEHEKRLELLQSARELNVNIDALEKVFGEVRLINVSPNPWIEWRTSNNTINKYFTIHLGSRELKIETNIATEKDSRHIFREVKRVAYVRPNMIMVYHLQSGEGIAIYSTGEVYMG